jgi:hypothetical protein
MKEYNKAGGKLNEGLVKRRGIEISMFTGGKASDPIGAPVEQQNSPSSFAENYARRRQESQAEEEQQGKYVEGSNSFVGPAMPEASKFALSDLIGGKPGITADTFFNNYEDIIRGIEDKLSAQPPVSVVYQDNSMSSTVAGGGGGSAPTISVNNVSNRSYDRSYQFNSLAGGNLMA